MRRNFPPDERQATRPVSNLSAINATKDLFQIADR